MVNFTKVIGLALISISIFDSAALADAITVPEPGSMSLFAIGAIALVLVARMLKSKRSISKAV